MRDAVSEIWFQIAAFVPRLLGFLLILIIGLLLAKWIAKGVDALLERVGFDRWVERGGIKKALAKSSYDASDIVSKIIYWALVLFVLQAAFGVFGPNPISELLQSVIAFLPKILVAIVIVVIAAAIAAAVRDLIANTLGGLSYGRVLANVAAAFILGLGIIAALNQVDVAVAVTMPVLIAVLATLSGILIVGVGGGLIRPMQARWEGYLTSMEQEKERIRTEVAKAPSMQEQMRAAADNARPEEPAAAPAPTVTVHPERAAQSAPVQQSTHVEQPTPVQPSAPEADEVRTTRMPTQPPVVPPGATAAPGTADSAAPYDQHEPPSRA